LISQPALQIIADRNEAVAKLIADVIGFRYLPFCRLGIRRHREIDERGWGGSDQVYAPPDKVLARFGFLGFGHATPNGALALTHTHECRAENVVTRALAVHCARSR
jgi:hypothetical protein